MLVNNDTSQTSFEICFKLYIASFSARTTNTESYIDLFLLHEVANKKTLLGAEGTKERGEERLLVLEANIIF